MNTATDVCYVVIDHTESLHYWGYFRSFALAKDWAKVNIDHNLWSVMTADAFQDRLQQPYPECYQG
jgi:hypothetical protein